MTEVAAALGISADSSGLAAAVRELRNVDAAARGAVEGISSFGRTADRAGAAAASLGQSASKSARDAARLESAYERVRSAIDPVYASSRRYESALKTLTSTERAGKISKDDLIRLNDLAVQKYLSLKNVIDQTAAAETAAASARERATATYERLRASVDKVFASSKQYEAGLTTLNTLLAANDITQTQYDQTLGMLAQKLLQVKTGTDSLAASTANAKREQDQAIAAYERTRASIDPMFAASKRYEAALENLDDALRRNIISQTTYNNLNAQASQALLGTGGAAGTMGSAMNGARYAITNASFQIQDFAVQVASGQSAMVAFTQQMPQLLGALGFTGKLAVWGAIAGTVVAAAGAIYMGWKRTQKAAEDGDTALEAYNKTLQKYVQLAGSAADSSGRLAMRMGNISYNQSLDAFNRAFTEFTSKAEGSYTAWEKFADELSGRNAAGMGGTVVDMLNTIKDTFNLPQAESSGLFGMIQKLGQTAPTSLQEVVDQAKALDAAFTSAYGSMDRAPAGVQDLWASVIDMGIGAASEIDSAMQNIGSNLDKVNAEIQAAIEKQKQQKAYADDYLTASQQTRDMLSAIAAYGEDSAQVEALRRDHALANADAMFQQQNIAGQLLVDLNNAAAATYDAEAATAEWADRMAAVNAQLQGAFSLLNSIGGGMVASAGIAAANKVLDAGGSAIAAEQARRRREEELRLYNEQDALIARGQSTPGIADMAAEQQRRQWEAEDEYQARIDAQREAEREAAKSARGGGGKGRKPAKSEAMKEAEREQKRMENDADRIFEKTRTNLERLAIEQQDLNELYAEGYFGAVGSVTAMDTLARAMKDVAEQYDPVLQKQKEWTDSMISGFAAMWTGGQSFIDTLANIAMKLAEMAAMEAFTTIFESSGLQKGIGAVIGSVFGVTPNAKGGVYDSPSLSKYSNQVVSSPTMFAFAKGAGLMGEAGPEAIMPLSRGPDGRLGVSADSVRGSKGNEGTTNVKLDLNVRAVPGDMFVPIVEEIAGNQADVRVQRASEAADRALPDRIAEHMIDPRYR